MTTNRVVRNGMQQNSIKNIIYWGENLAISDYWVGLGHISSMSMVVMALVLEGSEHRL